MKFLNKNNPWRPVYIACSLFLGIGYLLYFLAYFLPTPQWGRVMMTWAMPTVKALYSAERVGMINGTDPFPAQVVILYSAPASIVLGAWYAFWNIYFSTGRRKILLNHQKLPKKKKAYRFRYFFSGVILLLTCSFLLYVFFCVSATNFTWRDYQFFSSGIESISFVLVFALSGSLMMALSPLGFYMAFLKSDIFYKKED